VVVMVVEFVRRYLCGVSMRLNDVLHDGLARLKAKQGGTIMGHTGILWGEYSS